MRIWLTTACAPSSGNLMGKWSLCASRTKVNFRIADHTDRISTREMLKRLFKHSPPFGAHLGLAGSDALHLDPMESVCWLSVKMRI